MTAQGPAIATPGAAAGAARLTAPILLAVFMVVLIMPVSVLVGGVRLTPIRVFLLLTFIPMLVHLYSGRAGRLVAADIFISLFAVWMMLTILINNGIGKLPYASISVIEVLGGYLLGRCLIRNAVDYRYLLKLHLIVMLFLLPFSLIDHITGRQLWTQFLDLFGDVTYRGRSSHPRYGLQRVLNGFDHPILYGLFCSMAGASAFYAWRRNVIAGFGRLGFVLGMTFTSLSSGAFLSVMFQIYMIIWDWLTKGNWRLLIAIAAVLFVFLEFASNRGPFIIFIETMTFNQGTAWTRIIQWEYGTAEVMRNPIFGKGITGSWERPSWLTNSIDNYWLVIAFRHGIPGIVLLGLAYAAVIRLLVRTRRLPEEIDWIRTGFIITVLGVCFSLATVHIWDAISVYVYLFLGAGVWISQAGLDGTAPAPAEAPDPVSRRRAALSRAAAGTAGGPAGGTVPTGALPYSRFSKTAGTAAGTAAAAPPDAPPDARSDTRPEPPAPAGSATRRAPRQGPRESEPQRRQRTQPDRRTR